MSVSHPELSTEFELALKVVESVRISGGRTLFVGGWVRDRLLGYVSTDIDLEVYGVTANRLRTLLDQFGRVNEVGQSFTVYKIGPLDVALPRRESKTGRGHRGFTVTGDPNLTIEQAARRRDFTINAVAWDPLTEEYLDPYSGREDLLRRQLRIVDPDTFKDDSLRVLRAIQLAARFDLSIDEATKSQCRSILLDDLPPERVWDELRKLLLLASKPSIGFKLALEIGVIEQLFPEMASLVGCQQEPEWHPEGDVWIHNQLVIDQARTRIDDLPTPQKIALMLGAVCHDFGKPATTAFVDGRIRSYNHEEAGIKPTTTFLNHVNIYSIDGYDVRGQVIGLVAHHLKPGMWQKSRDGVGDGAFRRLARKVDLELLARLAKSDCLGRTGYFDCSAMDWFLDRARSLGVEHKAPLPLLMGRHLLKLGLPPGPRIGQILSQVYELQLDGQVSTVDEATQIARKLIDLGRSREP